MQLTQVAGPAGMLWVNDGGTGEVPVLFLHAACGNSTYWEAQLEHLRHSRRAVAFDLRGHGHSQPPADDDYSFAAMAEDVDAVITSLDLQRCILVGHSVGAAVAIEYAGRFRHRVAGLLLVDGPATVQYSPDQVNMIIAALRSDSWQMVAEQYWQQLLVGARSEVQQRVVADLRSASQEMLVEIASAQFCYEPIASLQQYHGPKLAVVTAANDTPASLHHHDPDFPHQVVNGTGHWLYLDKPEEFNRILDKFILTTDPPRSRDV